MGFCGSKSGRDYDKFKETGLTPLPSKVVATPIIDEAFLNVECKIINKAKMDPSLLDPSILEQHYSLNNIPGKDLHIFYFGEIVSMYKAKDPK